MFICRNAEGVHACLLKSRRGAWSSVRILKGYMVNKRLGTPALEHRFSKCSVRSTRAPREKPRGSASYSFAC